MAVFVVLLRGVNVGGAGTRLPMEALREVLVALGCRKVATYIQSGNAVVESALAPDELARRISAAVVLPNGTHPQVHVLPAADLTAALRENPFPEAAGQPKTLHLVFLDRDVAPDLGSLSQRAVAGERFVLQGRVFYLFTPEGYGRSQVAARVEVALGPARVTARNLATVMALDAMAQGLA